MSSLDRSILVIDSDLSWLDFSVATLRANGYDAHAMTAARAAREPLEAAAATDVALVLLDIGSLEQDTRLIEKMLQSPNAAGRSVVVVFPTELTPTRARLAFGLGAADCVSKPYDQNALLALVEQMLADHRLATASARPQTRSPSSVLVVEDNEDWREDLVRYLPPVEEVVTASDLQTAVDLVALRPFGVVVVDLRLVDADDKNIEGMALMRLVREKDRERGSHTHIVVVSAFGTPVDIREAYRSFDIDYYFDKRYLSPSRYRNLVRRALGGHSGDPQEGKQ
jgi:DNA-binding NtrC family response regulator